uniref:WYL domain-containing protein n=1 Tax=Methylobacter tundripaludum TaxID=173365 RepID=UPI00215758A8|nr:WYL domain-containing protein [Methylobacter tundripaludum]
MRQGNRGALHRRHASLSGCAAGIRPKTQRLLLRPTTCGKAIPTARALVQRRRTERPADLSSNPAKHQSRHTQPADKPAATKNQPVVQVTAAYPGQHLTENKNPLHRSALKRRCPIQKNSHALFNDKQIDIHYTARGEHAAQTQRTISPQQLIYYRDNWYLAAYCHHRDQLRVFAVDNIGSAKILDQIAYSTAPKQLEQFLTSSYGIFSGTAEHTAVLEFTKARAQWVADENWHPNQHGQWLDNGNYQLSIPFNGSRELIMDILKHGAEVEVKAPQFLLDGVRAQIGAMQKIYKK